MDKKKIHEKHKILKFGAENDPAEQTGKAADAVNVADAMKATDAIKEADEAKPKVQKVQKVQKEAVTLSLPVRLSDAIKRNSGRRCRERNRSELVTAAVELMLAIPYKDYEKLKALAAAKGVNPGVIIGELVDKL